jgi:gentisate 1,2-dioxygenase
VLDLARDCKADQLQQLYREMEPVNLVPLWEQLAQLVPLKPAPLAKPHLWTYDEVRRYLMTAGTLISAEKAERRVLILENPGLRGQAAITSSLYAGLQLILPGETAPCHRHTQSALRFVMEGEGAYTAIDGEKAVMRPFDLVLTPNWQWHDHGNSTQAPMIWLDGLDIPTVRHFSAGFAEKLAAGLHPETMPAGDTLARYGRNMRPLQRSTAHRRPTDQPLFHYPYADWRPALDSLAAAQSPDPHLGHALEFLNPANGGSIMPTISAQVRLVPAGFATRSRRSTDGSVFVVVSGSGTVWIDEEPISLTSRDMFVVPSWKAMRLSADEDLVLFGFSDRACQEKLSLFREECS